MEVIQARELEKKFGEVTAVGGLSLSIREGEIFGLVGPDGSGKTTTIRLLTSILEPTSGDAWVAGHHIVRESEAVKENIGYMSQRFGLYQDLTVLENIHFYADIYSVPRRGRAEKIDRLLSFSNLTPFKQRLAGNLSGGMKQKLGLVCALIHTPKVLFLDEPTNGVDPVARREFWRILDDLLRQGVAILVSTAYLDEAERCHRVGFIHEGRLLACGPPQEVKQMLGGPILEVRVSETRRATQLLRRTLGSHSADMFGDRIHVAAEDPEQMTGQVQELLSGQGIRIDGIRTIEPGLEDVLFSVLSRKRTDDVQDLQ